MHAKNSKKDNNHTYQTLEIGETLYKTILTPKFENRIPWVKPDEKKNFSPLPGTIGKIEAKKRDTLGPGENLLVMEAMKMLNSVKSNQNGIIKEVYVNIGDKIPKNCLILEFE